MQETLQFRPNTKIQNGLRVNFQYPNNEFFYSEKNNLIFLGKEPNINWDEYPNRIFKIAQEFAVKNISFTGSVAALIPHTRRVRVTCYFSSKK